MKLSYLLPLLCGLLAYTTSVARASIAYGSINNFDTVNDTGHECHGFEIEIEDCPSTSITYTYNYNHYGVPNITEDNSVAGHPKCRIRWESKKKVDGTWAAYTAIPSGPISPTNGHMFTNPAVNFGGEHFGVGYNKAVGPVHYNWLIDNGAGVLVPGGVVQVSTPSFTYYPPVGGGVAQVQAVIAPPPPKIAEPKEFGKAVWMKEIRTTTHSPEKVKLRELVSDDPDHPEKKDWKNGEPDEVETEWQILQKDYGREDGGVNAKKAAAPEDLPDGNEVVTRRYEFYKYIGPMDNETGEAMAENVGPDGLHGTGTKMVNGVEVDLSTLVIVGEYTGAQMAAVDVEAAVGLIDHVSEGKINTPYAPRTLVVEGALPFFCVKDGPLPAGMTFNAVTGVLSGTPTVSGEFNFKIMATDGQNPDVSKNYTLKVASALAALPAANIVDTTALPIDGGTTTGDGSFAPGSEVTVVATPNAGYRFVSWTDNSVVASYVPSHTFTLDVNHSLVANFALDVPQWTISTSANPVLGGSVTGAGTVDDGSAITLVATPNAGYGFTNWTEAGVVVSTLVTYAFNANADRVLVANFTALPTYTVSTSATPAVGGSTTGDGAFLSGTSATVMATANAGYVFTKWSVGGNQVSTAPSYTFTATGNKTLVANFIAIGIAKTITTNTSPVLGGTTTGGGAYATGDTATVVATANPNYQFSKWQEGSTTVSTNATYSFTVAANRTLVAKFTFSITATSSPSVGGTTEMDSLTYKAGDNAKAKAFSEVGYTFANWTENGVVVSSDSTYSFNATGPRALVANFISDTGITITASSAPAIGGTVSGDGAYAIGDDVTVSAMPNPGFAFHNWSAGGVVVSTDADYTFTANINRSLVASFAPAITIAATGVPAVGGSVIGAGDYASGAIATLEAIANPDYVFRNWTDEGTIVSNSVSYTFTVSAARALVANFSPAYTITASAWPTGGGTVLGASSVAPGSIITLVAAATAGYEFIHWTDSLGNEVSTSPSYTFAPAASGDYTANFSAGLAGIHFNFDTGLPGLALHTTMPFSQTIGGVTAAFSSPDASPPTVETEASTAFIVTKFAAHFIAPGASNGTVIEVQFDQAITGVSFNFATVEAATSIGSNLLLTATDHSSGLPVIVGSSLGHGSSVVGDTYPTGTLTFNSGVSFDHVRIELATFPAGAQKFLIDNLIVSPAGSTGGSMLLANPNWNITLTDYGYSDYLLDNTPGFEGREYLSGEWASAVSYTKDGVVVAPTWLDPNFLYPDWKTNSTFRVVQSIHLIGANIDGLPIAESIIANDDLEITLHFEMLDTVTGTPMGIAAAGTGGAGASIHSNRYVLNQSFRVRNISGSTISNVQLFQLLHGLISQRGVYDSRAYAGKLSQYHYDAALTGNDASATGSGSSAAGLEDTIAFHSKVAPTAFEIGHYGIEGNGVDNHFNGKPSDGVHLSIEANWQGAPYATRQGRDTFAPTDRWIAGGQRWSVGNLAAGQATNLDILLSLLTGTKVTTGGGNGGNHGGGSCNGGSSHIGGVDFEFDDISNEGTFFGDYSEADADEMFERENEGDFTLPTFDKPSGSVTQLWHLEYNGAYTGVIHLTFAYNPALLPEGFDESTLAIYHYNGSVWEKLPGTVNTVSNTLTVTTTSLSPFALGVQPSVISITAAGGTVTGAGTYAQGANVNLKAIPGTGWDFVGWEENGVIVNSNRTMIFTASGPRAITAGFIPIMTSTQIHGNNTLSLTWPANADGWVLKESLDLNTWVNSPAPITVTGGQKTATPGTAAQRCFFKLVKP
jgi:hypothetical protein